ncbi:putative integral membrane protein [Rubellimicrobium mesophilum DSM 19309]|uniref:Probable membrane transporter protein n=1 Tax=Rubellimicrobium mesophilum DSM 19309 TaxID=442562 RepID=A0A017HHT9_9RHOB|nr:sulfite exporter TauE/SafE family protein [Rubellimicrobium mesophilum]EYD73890.1 putative integral membrane protein [Rubellimicrobium mesophilum DSM 19309]
MDTIAFHDPGTILVLALAAVIVGLSKGGLAGLGVMAVPVLALVLPPVQAAAILLPILCLTDLVATWNWWGTWNRRTLLQMLPGALLGIGVGWLTAAVVPDAAVLLIVGVVALAFVGRWLWQVLHRRPQAPRPEAPAKASFWGGLAGYTSFVAHAGGPPFQVYTLPLGLDPRILTGTSVAFFAIVNYVKLIPYAALGEFDTQNLGTSAALAPLAVAFTFVGAWIIRRMRAEVFYPITYALTALVGLKLVWDGIAGL